MRAKYTLLLVALLFGLSLTAQGNTEVFKTSSDINRTGMMFLGGWALANFAYGGYEWGTNSGSRKYFGQMNVMWNIVNVSIAGFALYQNYTTDFSLLTPEAMHSKHNQTTNLYLINAGLDILYAAGGWYMIHAASKRNKYSDLLKGYGNSVILQASFLFAFDMIMFFIQKNISPNFNIPLHSFAVSPNELTFILTS